VEIAVAGVDHPQRVQHSPRAEAVLAEQLKRLVQERYSVRAPTPEGDRAAAVLDRRLQHAIVGVAIRLSAVEPRRRFVVLVPPQRDERAPDLRPPFHPVHRLDGLQLFERLGELAAHHGHPAEETTQGGPLVLVACALDLGLQFLNPRLPTPLTQKREHVPDECLI
jgi:hypothetical protein